jgi:PhnB protein
MPLPMKLHPHLALAFNGQCEAAFQETFWAARFGAVTDRFGVPWSINCEKP